MRGRPHTSDPRDPRPVIRFRWPLTVRGPRAPLIRAVPILCLSAALGLTAYRGLSSSSSRRPTASPPAPEAPFQVPTPPRDVVPFPANGTTIVDLPSDAIREAPLILETADAGAAPDSWVVVLRDDRTGRFVAAAFLRAGSIMTLLLPQGAYRLAIAGGRSWFGRTALFGPGTRAWRFERPLLLANPPSPAAHLTLRDAASFDPPFVPMTPADLHIPNASWRPDAGHAR